MEQLLGELESKNFNETESKEESLSLSDTNEDSNLTKLSVQIKQESKEDGENESELNENVELKEENDMEDVKDLKSEIVSKTKLIENDFKDEMKIELNENEITNDLNELNEVKSEKVCFENDLNETKSSLITDINVKKEEDIEKAVIGLVNELVNKVTCELSPKSNIHFSEASILSIEQSVSIVCDYLVDEVCRLEGKEQQNINNEDPLIEIVNAMNSCGKGRGRPRGRGGRGGRGARSSRGRGRAKLSNETNDGNENVPMKRSRRIQEMQMKKMAQLAEQMKQEQEKLEKIAKKKAEQNKEELVNGNKRKKKQYKVCI